MTGSTGFGRSASSAVMRLRSPSSKTCVLPYRASDPIPWHSRRLSVSGLRLTRRHPELETPSRPERPGLRRWSGCSFSRPHATTPCPFPRFRTRKRHTRRCSTRSSGSSIRTRSSHGSSSSAIRHLRPRARFSRFAGLLPATSIGTCPGCLVPACSGLSDVVWPASCGWLSLWLGNRPAGHIVVAVTQSRAELTRGT
jgi:hypothetical protein